MSTVDNNSMPARGTDRSGRRSLLCRGGMEEDVAAAGPASRAAFLLASQKKGDVFTLARLLRRTPEEIAAGGVWLPPSPPTFGGLICPWAEERHSGPPLGPAGDEIYSFEPLL